MEGQPAPPPADRLIATLAVAQHGVVSRAQLRAVGLTRNAIDNRIAQGRLHQLHRGVYAVGHVACSKPARWLAAVLACGEGAALSHHAAAELWGLIKRSTITTRHITLPARAGRAPRPGIVVHRSRTLSPADVTIREAIPVTTPTRTLLDMAEVVPRRALERMFDEGERLGLLNLTRIDLAVGTANGRAGAGKFAALRREHEAGSTWTRSELEERFLMLCRDQDLPVPDTNVQIDSFEVDFLWREARLIVETDGRAAHGTGAAFEQDRARDARLTADGYRVVRFTYRQVSHEPAVVTSLLRRLLVSPT